MTFELISPQRIRHESGFILQGKDRFNLEYIEGKKVLIIPVEDRIESDYRIFWERVESWEKPFEKEPITPEKLNKIKSNILSALDFEKI